MPEILFDHIAIAAHRIADATPFLVGELGGVSGFGSPSGEFRWWHWDFAGGGRIEVLEPDGPPGGFVHRFLDRRGPGIHHVTFKVSDLRGICRYVESLGFTVVGYDDSNPGWKEAFLHPREAMGIVVQFAEGGSSDGPPHRGPAPPEPSSRPPAVEIVGLRMTAGEPRPPLHLWHDALGGEVEESDRELRFKWPGSSMRLRVCLEPGTEDRPEAIELRAARPLALDPHPHPLLGTCFDEVHE